MDICGTGGLLVLASCRHGIVVPKANSSATPSRGKRSSSRKRELFCPTHPDQLLAGGDKRYHLHLLTAEELQQRGKPARKATLLNSAYPSSASATRGLKSCSAPSAACRAGRGGSCGTGGTCAPLQGNPIMGEFSRHDARRPNSNRCYWGH